MVWWISLGMENHSPGGQDEVGWGVETGRGQWRSGLSSWLCLAPSSIDGAGMVRKDQGSRLPFHTP